jgi:HlyD family secretion protein
LKPAITYHQEVKESSVSMKVKKWVIFGLSSIVLVGIGAGILLSRSFSEKETVYRETKVAYGSLTVGVTQSGSVDVGTAEQTFDLDMSAIQRAETNTDSSSSSTGMGNPAGGDMQNGGANPFMQMFNMAAGGQTSQTQESEGLPIAEAYVTVGSRVAQGDPIYRLEEENVAALETQLSQNVEKASADLDAVLADQKLSKQTAQYTYDESLQYGSYASEEYQNTITALERKLNTAQTDSENAEKQLSAYEEELTQAQTDYEAAKKAAENMAWSRDHADKENAPGSYASYFQLAQNAQTVADQLETTITQLQDQVTQAQEQRDTAVANLESAKQALEQGILTAEENKKLRQLAYDTAQETYDVTCAYLEQDVEDQQGIYDQAKVEWENYSTSIKDDCVYASYSGVVTSVNLAAGDTLHTNDVLITLYNEDDLSMTLTVSEDNMTDIALDTKANITLTAYPDTIYEGVVTEIGDAETDSWGNVTHEVTVTLQGDVSGIFQGMTGEVTFVTREQKDVLYVSNRAITRQGDQSYVQYRNSSGQIQTKEVTTGFSDGINVEILSGLNEGDVVLIEG